MSVLVLIPVTLLANGIGFFGGKSEDDEDETSVPLIVENGCNIGLNKWYMFLTGIACFKLIIEVWRYMYVKLNFQESLILHMGGNYLLMPIAFVVFFIYTQTIWENSNPDPDRILSYQDAQMAELEQNECVTGDLLSQSLYSTF